MLVINRKLDEKIIIRVEGFENIEVMVVEVRGETVKLGINAPKIISVDREEIYLKKIKQDPPDC